MNTQRIRTLLVVLISSLVLGCGGGGGGGGDGGDNVIGGIDRGGITISQGPITGFGSVIVNGVRFGTAGATITVDDRPGTESELRVGQVVRVEGTVDASGTTGTARSIRFDNQVEGPVQTIDLGASRLVVLGQVVLVDARTSFDDGISPRSIEGLAVGDRVEVSGFVATDGSITATRVERKVPSASVEVQGTAGSVDSAARRLEIGQLVVSYGSAQLIGFPNGQPANGDFVEVKGAVDGSGVLAATSLELRSPGLGGTGDDSGELEGLVTRFASAADFDVAGQRVSAGSGTQYEGGSVADLAVGVNVEVEGGFDATGRIVARKIQFRRDSDVEISGLVDSVNAAGGSLIVLGATVRTNSLTRFEDQSDFDLERFGLADLRIGDYVEIRAYVDAGTLVATVLERDDPEDRVEVQGPVDSIAPPDFTISGLAITTDAQTEFRDNNGASISSAAFFAAAPGRQVKVRGTVIGSAVLAERAELED